MDRHQGPSFDSEEQGQSPPQLFGKGDALTQTIDLNAMFPAKVTESGSFDLRQVKQKTFEKLLEAISVPTLLIAPTHAIVFTNSAFRQDSETTVQCTIGHVFKSIPEPPGSPQSPIAPR